MYMCMHVTHIYTHGYAATDETDGQTDRQTDKSSGITIWLKLRNVNTDHIR